MVHGPACENATTPGCDCECGGRRHGTPSVMTARIIDEPHLHDPIIIMSASRTGWSKVCMKKGCPDPELDYDYLPTPAEEDFLIQQQEELGDIVADEIEARKDAEREASKYTRSEKLPISAWFTGKEIITSEKPQEHSMMSGVPIENSLDAGWVRFGQSPFSAYKDAYAQGTVEALVREKDNITYSCHDGMTIDFEVYGPGGGGLHSLTKEQLAEMDNEEFRRYLERDTR